jgi:peptide/nickel transport system permease protein
VLTFLVRRILSGLAMLFVISTVAFMLVYLAGADIARRLLGQSASPEAVAQRASELGLDRPLPERYSARPGSTARR